MVKDTGVASGDAFSHLMPGWPVSGPGDEGLPMELRLNRAFSLRLSDTSLPGP